MRIALISPYSDIFTPGLRSISAYLRANGVDTRLIFIPNLYVHRVLEEFLEPYNSDVLRGATELCRDVDIVAVSLSTNLYNRAVQLTSYLKKRIDVPFVWGGIHATIRPEECLEHADIVVIGEGEETMLDIAKRQADPAACMEIPNVCIKTNDGIRKNPVRPLIQDLDSLPAPDFDNPDYNVFDPDVGKFVVPDLRMLLRLHGKGPSHGKNYQKYLAITTRGCPFSCAYCVNDVLVKLYGRKGYIRRRSVEAIISELQAIRNRYEFINRIVIFDDSFLAGPTEWIEGFAARYKESINLPLFCMSSPSNLSKRKLDALVDAGLTTIQVGIQTGSDRINEIYNRAAKNADVVEAAELLNGYADRLRPLYDIIVDNPYETHADRMETVKLMMKIKKPFSIQLFSLTMFPGTEICERAKRDGLVEDEMKEVYNKFYMEPDGKFTTLLLSLVNRGAPSWLMRLLTRDSVSRLLSGLWLGPMYKALYVLNLKLGSLKDRVTRRV
ncbi:MAG: B12-binding domain-containing radical SAM protein [Candidatus Coatesbacteria bacterium]|nr:B12-binding domain-containing radical SAM protein [Candidatus Coatesbacteria bacterium]